MSSAIQSLDQFEAPEQSIYDALLATCMLLQIQSAFISDGFQDYLIMGRGAGLLMQRVRRCKTTDDWQLRDLRAYVDRRIRLLDTSTLAFQAAAIASSLASLEPSCLTVEDKEFCTGMQDVSYWLQQPQIERAFHAH